MEKYLTICRQICRGQGYDLQDIHWEEFYAFLEKHHLITTFYDEIKDRIPSKYRSGFEIAYHTEKIKIDSYIDLARDLTAQLYQENIYGFLITGGFVRGYQLYGDIYKCHQNELQILCDEKDIVYICRLLNKNGFGEQYLDYFSRWGNLSQRDKELIYLDQNDKVFIRDDMKIVVRTRFHQYTEAQVKGVVNRRQVLLIKGFAFPVMNREDKFHWMYCHLFYELNIREAMYGAWALSNIFDFYAVLRRYFGILVTLPFGEISPLSREQLSALLYMTKEVIGEEDIRAFCEKTGINYNRLHYCHHWKIPIKECFLSDQLRREIIGNTIREKTMAHCAQHINSRVMTPYLNPKTGEVWMEYQPHIHTVVLNKYFAQACYGFCHNDRAIYFSIPLFPYAPSICLTISIMNVDRTSRKTQYCIDCVVEDDQCYIQSTDLPGHSVKALVAENERRSILTVELLRRPEYILEGETTDVMYMNWGAYIWKLHEKIYPPLAYARQKHHFCKILMEKYK